ncbi:MAG: UPF0280 family protein [Candidatus Bathyarchaeia archaeon]
MSYEGHNPPEMRIAHHNGVHILWMTYKETKASLMIDDEILGINILNRLYEARRALDVYRMIHPEFFRSLSPLDPKPSAPEVAFQMAEAASRADVGPSAAVAGALIDAAVKDVNTEYIILENGGEIYAKVDRETKIGIYAGPSPFTGKVVFTINGGDPPIGVGTSSASVGYALTFGEADAATAIADNVALADAAATAICNTVEGSDPIWLRRGLRTAKNIKGIRGAVVIKGSHMMAWGDLPKVSFH